MHILVTLPIFLLQQTLPAGVRSPYVGNWNAQSISWIRTHDVLALVRPTGQHQEDRGKSHYYVDDFAVVDGGGTLSTTSISVLTPAIRVDREPNRWYTAPTLNPARVYLLVARKPSNNLLKFLDPAGSINSRWNLTECPIEGNDVAGSVLIPTSLKSLKPNNDFGARVMWNIVSGLESRDELVATSAAGFYHGVVADYTLDPKCIDGTFYQDWMAEIIVPYARKAAEHQSPRARFWIYGLIAKWQYGDQTVANSRRFLDALDQVLTEGGSLDLTEQLLIGRGSHAIDLDHAVRIAAKTDSMPLRMHLLGCCTPPDTEGRLQKYLRFLDDPEPMVQDAVIGHLVGSTPRRTLGLTSTRREGAENENRRRREFIISKLRKIHLEDLQKGFPTIVDADIERYAKG